MDDIKKITGIVVNGWHRFIDNPKEKYHHYHVILENKQNLEIFRKDEIKILFGDEMEFFGKDYGSFFYVFSFKVLRKYTSPPPPIDPQMKLNEFENVVKKQEGEQHG